ncbi:putative quinol monooxygenase [Devosia sp. SL43]|uniref:putative quinol monooxygenase n=1 Tax=Devosia sp. SL43 TaxID=2806348 RepID=UPI001F221C6E|nr:antibiotic biosynthesis monooxygenase [Devosia sp. SL43]UJW85144.1 antibiotic biosynthesis monooxygenase [Devosia sp. SL43]
MSDERMVRIAEIEVDPARLDAYKALLAEVGRASLELEPGVLMLHSVSLKDAPTHIRVFEVYASRAAYEEHIQTPHFLSYKADTADMVTALHLIEVDPILLAAK